MSPRSDPDATPARRGAADRGYPDIVAVRQFLQRRPLRAPIAGLFDGHLRFRLAVAGTAGRGPASMNGQTAKAEFAGISTRCEVMALP